MTTNQPKTKLPNARRTPRFAGIATFCRFPRLDDVEPANQPVDWALYGVPFDAGVTYRPGARFGPRAIRDASQYIKPVNPELDVNIAETFSLADAGDAPVNPYSCEQNQQTVAQFATNIATKDHTRLFAVGGDHSIAYANIKATYERLGRPKDGLAMLHFDAHLDTTDVVWDHKWTHASPFIRAIEDGLINPKRMLSMGIRGPLNSANDLEFGRANGVRILTAEQCRRGEASSEITNFINEIGETPTYLTFDIDCVDPAYAPGTGTPCCGGFTSSESIDLVRQCRGANIVGADLVEVLPDRDHADITSLLASHIVFEILSIAAWREEHAR